MSLHLLSSQVKLLPLPLLLAANSQRQCPPWHPPYQLLAVRPVREQQHHHRGLEVCVCVRARVCVLMFIHFWISISFLVLFFLLTLLLSIFPHFVISHVLPIQENTFAFLQRQPQFRQLHQAIQNNPNLLPILFQQLSETNPELLQVIMLASW